MAVSMNGRTAQARLRAELGPLPLVNTVRAAPGRLSAISIFLYKSVVYGAFVWRAGRLTAKNGGFRRGQVRGMGLMAGVVLHFDDVAAQVGQNL
jgi:hypothetical protein